MIQRYVIKAVADSEYETNDGRMQPEKVTVAYIPFRDCTLLTQEGSLGAKRRIKAQQSNHLKTGMGRHTLRPTILCEYRWRF